MKLLHLQLDAIGLERPILNGLLLLGDGGYERLQGGALLRRTYTLHTNALCGVVYLSALCLTFTGLAEYLSCSDAFSVCCVTSFWPCCCSMHSDLMYGSDAWVLQRSCGHVSQKSIQVHVLS